MKIEEALCVGENNTRTGKDLAAHYNCDIRTITEQIEAARRKGTPICAVSVSGTPGYFLAATRQELERYCNRLEHRAGELDKTRKALEMTAATLPDEGKA